MTTTPSPTTTPAPNPPALRGPLAQRFTRDEEGHRFYEIDWHVETNSFHDNIAFILANWPLFAVGSPFDLASAWPEIRGTDAWAFCTPQLNIAPHRDHKEFAGVRHWVITQYWSTKQSWRCQTFPIENPLLEPAEYTGDFVHEQRQASVSRFGKPLIHPNYQPITGPATEYQYSYPTINISFNSATLPLSTYVNLVNKLNDAELWGLPPRTIRFADARWERKVYGNCFYYYHTSYVFHFDIKGFDKEVPAEGSYEYGGSGSFDDPASYVQAKDAQGDNTTVPLDDKGRRLVFKGYTVDGLVEYVYPQYVQKPQVHDQGNLLLLGIPATL